MVICRTTDGEMAFLTGHAPFVGALGIAIVRIRQADGTEQRAAVHGGFVEVRDNQVSILSDVAELPEQIDVERARRARQEAERRLGPGRRRRGGRRPAPGRHPPGAGRQPALSRPVHLAASGPATPGGQGPAGRDRLGVALLLPPPVSRRGGRPAPGRRRRISRRG